VAFTASSSRVPPGEPVTLRWETEGAVEWSLSELSLGEAGVIEGPSGTVQVVPPDDGAVFVLTATNATGLKTRAVAAVRVDPDTLLAFEALPRQVPARGTTTLVWSAPGATRVLVEVADGGVVANDLPATGVFEVQPPRSTRYRLRADHQAREVDVEVGPGIRRFVAMPPAATPGTTVVLAWETENATAVRVRSPGLGDLALGDAGVSEGTVSITMPAVPAGAGVSFALEVTAASTTVRQTLFVPASTTPRLSTATAPRYVRAGESFALTWASEGADLVRVSTGGAVVFEGPATGATTFPAPPAETTFRVTALEQRSGAQSAPVDVVVEPVSAPRVVRFAASSTAIAQGGQPVTLTWEVPQARRVTIRDDGGELGRVEGRPAEQGSLVVFPNAPTTTFTLEASNQAGDEVSAPPVAVTVAAVGGLTLGPRRPLGTSATITGTTVAGGTTVRGFPTVVTNAAGDAFVDISASGTPVSFTSADTASTLVNPGPFRTTLFGVPIVDGRFSVSTNGWLLFSTFSVTGPGVPAAPIGTSLNPLALAVFFGNLRLGSGGVQWRVDEVAGEPRLIVQWTDVEESAAMPQGPLTFQAQVFSSGKVVYAYRTVPPFSGPVTAGVVNANESGVLVATASAPPNGTTFSFFSEASLPTSALVQPTPWTGFVKVPGGEVRVTADPRLPTGALAIVEANPISTVPDGEWVEVMNQEAVPYDLQGWALGGTVLTSPLLIPPQGRAVLALAPQANDGVSTRATYGAALFQADGGGAALLSYEGVAVSRAAVPALPDAGSLLAVPGRSVRFDPPAPWLRFPVSTVTQLSCEGTGTYGSAGQQGSPGLAHPRCFPYVLESDAGVAFQSIAATGTQLLAGTSAAANEAVVQATLPFPVRFGSLTSTTLFVSTNGFLTLTPNATPTPVNRTLPSASGVPGTIAPFWDDLQGSTLPGSGLYLSTSDPDGTPGSGDEVVIVSWEGFRTSSTTVVTLNFQVRFWGTGDITFHYGDLAATSGTIHQGSSATAWLESPDNRAAAVISVNSATAPGLRPQTSFRFRFTGAP
jgi:hypothetical protein